MWPFAWFHLQSGVRLSLRYFAMLVVLPVLWIGLAPYPSAAFGAFAESLANDNGIGIWCLMAMTAILFDRWAILPMVHSIEWFNHLPVSAIALRRSAWLGLAALQLPMVLGSIGVVAAGRDSHATVHFAVRCMTLLFVPPLLVLPVRRRTAVAFLGFAVVLLGFWPSVPLHLAGLAGVAVIDRLSGPLVTVRKRHRYRASWPGTVLLGRIAGRALGLRILAPMASGLAVLGCGWLFVANNQLEGDVARSVYRSVMILASSLVDAGLIRDLKFRRPPWPFLRSLPCSSATRVLVDAAFFAAASLPVVIAATFLQTAAGLEVLLLRPAMAFMAAGALRKNLESEERRTPDSLLASFATAALTGLLPWLYWPALLLSPLSFQFAVRREREQKTARWLIFQQLEAGDTTSWSS